MQLLNLKVDRIIIHQVFRRGPDGQKKSPTQGNQFIRFEPIAMQAFRTRIIDALGEGSRAVQMEIVDQSPQKVPQVIDKLVDEDDENFPVSSFDIAKLLTEAQHSKVIPGGIVVVFSGTYGAKNSKFVGLMKAEIHTGYEKAVTDNGEISLNFIEELLLTPSSRLYKTAGYFERDDAKSDGENLNDKWIVMVSDSQISRADGKAAAQYFYSDFLGCDYPKSSARTTMQFYEAATTFFSNLAVSPSKKSNLFNALTTYLKVDTSSTISAAEFAESYFDDVETQDAFTNHVADQGLPLTAFTKDNEYIQSKLKFHKIEFQSQVKIWAPSDTFKDLVKIEAIDGDADENGVAAQWTKIIVKDRIVDQR